MAKSSESDLRVGFLEGVVLLLALIGGTGCSLMSKIMFGMTGLDNNGEEKKFTKPLFQTLSMFLVMTTAIPTHWAIVWFRRQRRASQGIQSVPGGAADPMDQYCTSPKMLGMLLLPALSDTVATALAYIGLMYITASSYQMAKGLIILFVAVQKVLVLRDHLFNWMWAGLALNVVAIVLVGVASAQTTSASASDPVLGLMIIIASVGVQSIQYVAEELYMARATTTPAPPLIIVGMEGVWGTLLTLFVFYPIASQIPGDDEGTYELLSTSISMISSSPSIQWALALYGVCILLLNFFGIYVTFLLSSIYKSLIDNARPFTVWGVDILIFYFFSNGSFGEPWNRWCWMQLGGLFLLIFGTSVYNGSIMLPCFEYVLPPEDDTITGFRSPAHLTSPLIMASPLRTAAAPEVRAAREGGERIRRRNSESNPLGNQDTARYGSAL